MRQVTTHKRVGDIEHARTELRGQPHEFAQYQFHLDKLHAKRVAREKRKEAAALEEPFPFAKGEPSAASHMAFRALTDYFFPLSAGDFVKMDRTVGYGMTDACGDLGINRGPLTATEMKKATDAMEAEGRRKYGAPLFGQRPWHGLRRPWEDHCFAVPTVDEMLKADAAAGPHVTGRMTQYFGPPGDTTGHGERGGEGKIGSPGIYAKAAEEVASRMLEEKIPVYMDGVVIGVTNLKPGLRERVLLMIAKEKTRRAASHKPVHGGYTSPRAG